jgi:hypothetical protein
LADFPPLLQDAASRGPLGSVVLLFSLRARPLASIGAVITIFALAFDPFIQQILQYPSILSIDSDKESSVLRASKFAIAPNSTEWLNAVSAGVWSGAERYPQQPICPSGNCKWEEYSSTGWCSRCQDATPYAKIVDCETDADWFEFDHLYHTGYCKVDFGHGNRYQVLLSPDVESWYGSTATIIREAVWPLTLLNDNLSMPLENETFAGVTNPIVALGSVHVQRCDEADFGKGLCITFAEECVLSLCTRRVETSVVNGTTRTAFTDEDFGCLSQIHDDYGRATLGTDTHCWQAGKLCADQDFVNLTSFYSPEDTTYPELEFCSEGIVVQTEQHDGSQPLNSTMVPSTVQGELLMRLMGNQTTLWTAYGGEDYIEGRVTASSITMDYITVNGLGPVLAGVAASLTQQALANTSVEEKGTVYTTETFVAVDWPWLIYPATLVLAAIILLILTAIHSHQCGLRIWKSSMLPLLYRTLDPDLLARQQVLHDVSTMTGVAGRAKVTLVETSREDGVVLTQ